MAPHSWSVPERPRPHKRLPPLARMGVLVSTSLHRGDVFLWVVFDLGSGAWDTRHASRPRAYAGRDEPLHVIGFSGEFPWIGRKCRC